MKKSFLRPTAASKQSKDVLEGQPGRDHQALILPLSVIKVGENIRTEVGNIEELAESIREHGLLQPLVVRKDGSTFSLVAGHRRLMALKHLDIKEAPVRIHVADENQAHVVRLIENIQREELSGAEEVMAVAKLLPMFDGNQSALCRALGRSKSYVSRCIKAADLIRSGVVPTSQLSKSILFELADSSDPQQAFRELASKAKPTVKSVRQIEGRRASGPIPGGLAVDRVLKFSERRDGRGFTLRVHFDFDRSSEGDRNRLLNRLREIIDRLEKEK